MRNGAVHPRVCGEHKPLRGLSILSPGSSPRVRGTSRARLFLALLDRFIPACAGNIYAPSLWESIITVHPRVCGEHFPAISRTSR